MQTKSITLQPVKPAYEPEHALNRVCRLPFGGPWGTGGRFPKGTVLGCVGGAPANAVITITISGAPTGSKLALDYTADKVYSAVTANLASAHATVAQLQAACDEIWGAGNTLVAGTPGTSFTITFQGVLAQTRIGGLLSLTRSTFTAGTAPAATAARTTPGTSGAGQFDKYVDAGTNNAPQVARSVLMYDYLSDPLGGFVADAGVSGQPYSPPHYITGFFNVADLDGLDANGVTDPGWRIVEGAAITEAGAVVGIGV
jgi:hypothetical protein